MPELPEVETVTRGLAGRASAATIEEVRILDGRVIRGCSRRIFVRRIKGRTIESVCRRAKAIVVALSGARQYLVVQLMMTGQLIVREDPHPSRFAKIIFKLSNGLYLHYNDQRLFGRLQIVDDPQDIPYLRMVGPEPLGEDFSAQKLAAGVQRRDVPIKTLLMNHTFVAGIGNIYASEICFESRIHPRRPARSLTGQEVRKLYRSTVAVLNEAIRLKGTSMHSYRDARGEKGKFMSRIRVYGRANDPCPRCGSTIQKVILSGRSTFYCDRCQQ